MDQAAFPGGDKPSPTRKELQGPRPTPLKVNKDSYKIVKKPPVAPQRQQEPVVIYAVSPKIIHTTVSDFMSLVQRLTGSSSSSSGDISPAARLASIEKTSPCDREKEREKAASELMGLVEGVEVSQIPGILSPAPASLPVIPPGFFSPVADSSQNQSLLHDLSPFMSGNNMFMIQSPSNLFSAPMVSPSPSSSLDFFNPFFDF